MHRYFLETLAGSANKTLKHVVFALSLSLVVMMGWIDYATGPDFTMLLFYLIPVLLTAWIVGKCAAVITSVVSAVVLLIVDNVGMEHAPLSLALYWNDATKLIFFLFVTYIISSLKSALEREKLTASTDPLTGVSNRRRFYELAEIEIERQKRYGHPFTVSYIDIDNFKQINDTLGHAEGDNLLRFIAESIRHNMRKTDIVGRLGGDEFALLMPETGEEAALKVVSKVQTLKDLIKQEGLTITLSIGMVTYLIPPASVDEMIKTADSLMYVAKKSGKKTIMHEVIGKSERKIGLKMSGALTNDKK